MLRLLTLQFRRQLLPESVGFIEKADHADEDGADVLCGVPALARQLARLRVVHGRVEDGDAEVPVLVDVGVPHLGQEPDGGRVVRVVRGELDVGLQQHHPSDRYH